MEKKYTLKQKRGWCEAYLRGDHGLDTLESRRQKENCHSEERKADGRIQKPDHRVEETPQPVEAWNTIQKACSPRSRTKEANG